MRRCLPVMLMLVCGSFAAAADAPPDLGPADARLTVLEAERLRALERLIRLLLSEGALDEARKVLEPEVTAITSRAASEAASVAEVRLVYFMGIVEELSHRPADRDARFETARRLTPADEFPNLLLGRYFDDLHREDISEAALARVLELDPEDSAQDAEALGVLMQSAYTNRRFRRAAELSERMLKTLRRTTTLRVPESVFVHYEYLNLVSRGFARLEEKTPDGWREALETCERAWRLDPARIDAAVLGERLAAACPDKARAKDLAATWRKRSVHVVQVLRGAIAAEPRDPQHYNALAWFLAELDRDHDEAIRAAQRALELRPHEPAFIDTLAEVQFKKGDARAAVRTIRRVIDVCPFANDYYRHQLDRFEAALKVPKAPGVP